MKKFIFNLTVTLSVTFVLGIFLPAAVYALMYAVLFSGGIDKDQNYDECYQETLRMWEITTGKLGYKAENVYVLFADGVQPGEDRCVTWDENGKCLKWENSDWRKVANAHGHIMSATAKNLKKVFDTLSKKMGEDDGFSFWSFDHGYSTNPSMQGNGGLSGWGRDQISDDDFASWVEAFNVKTESYAFAQCYAADMADDLFRIDGSEHRFAAWAARWNEHATSDIEMGWAHAWVDGLAFGLTGTYALAQYALKHDSWGPYGTGDEHPGWRGANFNMITNEPVPEHSTMLWLGIDLALRVVRLRKRC
jgi:hypothetical protein